VTFDEKSTVTPASEDAGIAKVQYNFTNIAAIAQKDKDSLVDVLAVLSEVREKVDIRSKAGKDMTKREVVLKDSSGAGGASAIELTLWGEKASKGDLVVGQVVAVKAAKVSEWNTRSLSMMQSSSLNVDPDLPEAHQLRGWFEGEGRGAAPTMLSARGGGGMGGGGGGGPMAADTDLSLRHGVGTLKGGEGEGGALVDTTSLLVVKATIKHIRNDVEKISYPACRNARDGGRQCNKKLENNMGSWSCQNCGQVDAPEHRYMISTCLQDVSGDNFVTIFDQEAQQLLGMKAAELLALGGAIGADGAVGAGGEPGPEYMRTFQQQLFTQHLFTIKCKADTYKDEQKLSATVVKLRPLKGALLVQECHALVGNIKKYLSA
jgi:replication factor A1